jgi:SNW domain-containing protein 1
MLAKYENLVNKNNQTNNNHSSKPGIDVLNKTTQETKAALERVVSGKIKSKSITGSTNINGSIGDARYIRYTPSLQGVNGVANLSNPTATSSQRIIRLTELPKDPLEPVKFKHKRIPRDAGEEPVPVMHSPPRKLTLKDQQDFKVPPCISNWKNAKGYTIPLEMRLSADGRNMRDFTVSDKFSKFADVMYMTEKQARQEIEERNRIQESIKMVDTLKKEKELREAAKEAREKKMAMAVSNISSVNTTRTEETEVMLGKKHKTDEELELMKLERNNLRNMRKKEIEQERKMELNVHKKGRDRDREKANPRDEDRDISEKIALGQAQPTSRDTMIDARLYNQVTGMESGFKDEEDYDLYDKPLFADRTAASIYKNVKAGSSIDDDGVINDNTLDSKKLMEKIHQRGKMFEGADIKSSQGGRPIEFEKTNEEYGLNDSHTSKKK